LSAATRWRLPEGGWPHLACGARRDQAKKGVDLIRVDTDEPLTDAIAAEPGCGDVAANRLLANTEPVSGLADRLEPSWALPAAHPGSFACRVLTLWAGALVP
jgi:hypothetical protein